jgi:hypothetical protein
MKQVRECRRAEGLVKGLEKTVDREVCCFNRALSAIGEKILTVPRGEGGD